MKFLDWRKSKERVPQLGGERGLTTRSKAGLPSMSGQFDIPPVSPPVTEPEKEPKKKNKLLNKLKQNWRYGFVLGAGALGAWGLYNILGENNSMGKNVVTGFIVNEDPNAFKNGYLVHGSAQLITQNAEGKADTAYYLYPDQKRVDLMDHKSLDHRPDAEMTPAEIVHETPLSELAAEGLVDKQFIYGGIKSERGWFNQAIRGDQVQLARYADKEIAQSRNDKLEEYSTEGKVMAMWEVDKATAQQYQQDVKNGKKSTWLPQGLTKQ